MIQWPLNFLSQVTQWVSRALTAAERVFEVLDTESESEKARGRLTLEPIAKCLLPPFAEGHLRLASAVSDDFARFGAA